MNYNEQDAFGDITELGCSGVYLLLQDEEVVYIGASLSIWGRVDHHLAVLHGYRQNDLQTEKQFNRILVKLCDEDKISDVELALWHKYQPRYNKKPPAGYHPQRGATKVHVKDRVPLNELLNLK
jgi:hypothetical protein